MPTAVYLTSQDFDAQGELSDRPAAELDSLLLGTLSLARALLAVPPVGPPPLVARPRLR